MATSIDTNLIPHFSGEGDSKLWITQFQLYTSNVPSYSSNMLDICLYIQYPLQVNWRRRDKPTGRCVDFLKLEES